jgi:hypothetical protein
MAPVTKKVRYRIHSIDIDTTEDKYDEGLVGGPEDQQVLNEYGPSRAFNSLKELFAYAVKTWSLPEDRDSWSIMPDPDDQNDGPLIGTRLCGEYNVDKDNCPPTRQETELWKVGKFRIWTAHVNLYILRTEEEDVPFKEIEEQLGIKEA